MGGRGSGGGKNSGGESVKSFLERAVGNNDKIVIRANDMPTLEGTKQELFENSEFKKYYKDLYFGRFQLEGNKVIIDAFFNSVDAERMKKRLY